MRCITIVTYITVRYSYFSDIKASDLIVNMLNCLPSETLLQIFKYLSFNDIQNLETFEGLKDIISHYKVFLPREPRNLKIVCDNFGLNYFFTSINTSKNFNINSNKELINTIRNCSIEGFELHKINGMGNMTKLENDVFPEMYKSRQNNILSLSLIDVNIPSNDIIIWKQFIYNMLNRNCKTMIIDNVYLSKLFDHRIFNECRKMTHVKWIVNDSEEEEKIKCGERVMANFTYHIRHSSPHKMENLYAYMEMISPKSLVMFIETWLSISRPSRFTIVIEKCDDKWKEDFSNECIKNNLINYNRQINSNKSRYSYVKMRYDENNGITKVTFDSIIDMPTNLFSQRITYGRFYIDF
uniref:F-box domain-containing protein n=1 Tax=Strongyloides stercoralis TaxID=6248 RepID=A0AAF5DJW6_STRER